MPLTDSTYVPQYKRQGVEWVDLMVAGHYDLSPVSLDRARAEVVSYQEVVEDSPGLRPNDAVEFRVILREVHETVIDQIVGER